MAANDRDDDGLGGAIRTRASRHRAPPALAANIMAALAAEAGSEAGARSADSARGGWHGWGWLRLGSAFACGVLAGLAILLVNPAPIDDPLAREVVASHVRSLMVSHLSDVASSDQHSVKPWFNGKLDFSPPVEDLAAAGFPLAGGRLDYVNQRPVAALIYHRHQHTINVFVWPASGQPAQKPARIARQGFNLESWRKDGMQFWAVSDLNDRELGEFTSLLGAGSGGS